MKLLSYQNQIETVLAVTSSRMAVVSRGRLAAPAGKSAASAIPAAPLFCALRQEGEDALLNGMTRSLQRRLLGLNIPSISPKAILTVPTAAKAA